MVFTLLWLLFFVVSFFPRTKWKRQTAVGLELLAEAGNYAAFQRLYGGSPYLAPWPYAAAQAPPHLTGSTPIDLYYRQAAAAAVLQKPLTYRMYPSVPPLASAAALSSLPVHPPPPIPHLNASSSLTTLSNYYQTATQTLNSSNENNNFPSVSSNLRNASPNRSDDDEQRNSVEIVNRSPSPQLNPGSPPERNESPAFLSDGQCLIICLCSLGQALRSLFSSWLWIS
uniref:Uncharacterized protein n=1 Tax=Glossina austeni TaxID=7395 RepID=A0A1A9VC00_GLOAU